MLFYIWLILFYFIYFIYYCCKPEKQDNRTGIESDGKFQFIPYNYYYKIKNSFINVLASVNSPRLRCRLVETCCCWVCSGTGLYLKRRPNDRSHKSKKSALFFRSTTAYILTYTYNNQQSKSSRFQRDISNR